jgi:CheY-like chemotaxis protein
MEHAKPAAASPGGNARGTKPSPAVLVIDDSDIDRQVMVELLSESGLSVRELPTPIGATRVAREVGAKVVVIDQNLPALNGAKLAALFRSNPALRDIKLVLISSSDEREMAKLVTDAGADAFVSKTRMHSELVSVVRKLLVE